jgi:ribosomal protein S18 acetylase RimI-like enzyme
MLVSQDVAVRAGTPADAPAIAQIGAKAFRETYREGLCPEDIDRYITSTYNIENMASELLDTKKLFLVAYAGEQVGGFVRLRPESPAGLDDESTVELSRLYLDESWIGRGVGSALVKEALQRSADSDYKTCWLLVWDKNERAVAFYEKWGFTHTDSFQ